MTWITIGEAALRVRQDVRTATIEQDKKAGGAGSATANEKRCGWAHQDAPPQKTGERSPRGCAEAPPSRTW
jgi:hypothetical protein